jgi:hypothetical protein
MHRTTAVALGAPLLAAIAVVGVLVRSTGTDSASPEAPAGAAATPRPGSVPGSTDPGRAGDVMWLVGPWGEATVAGHQLLIPTSREHGPLRDRGNGWASDYAPTPEAAAIAVLRGPWFVFAAPAELRSQLAATVLTPAAAAEPGPVNPSTGWALPGELLAGLAAQDVRLLGAQARLTDEGKAEVDVYQRVMDSNGPLVIRSTHRLTYTDRQWLIEADYSDSAGEEIPTSAVPTTFTIAAPEVRP